MAKDYKIGYEFNAKDGSFQRTVGGMRKSVDNLATESKAGLLKWAAGFASVGIAIEGLKKTMNSTEGTADMLDAAMGSLEGTMQGVMRTIATGDWASLISNITNAAKATRDLKVAMDELEDTSASNALKRSKLSVELEKTRVQIAAAKDATLKASLIKDALDIQKTITGIEVDEQNQRINNKYDYFGKLLSQDENYFNYLKKQIPIIAENWAYFGSEATKAGLEAQKSDLEYTKSIGMLKGARVDELRDIKLLLFALEDYVKIKDDLSKPGEFNLFLGDLAKLNEIVASGEQDLIKLTKALTTVENKLAKIQKVQKLNVPKTDKLKFNAPTWKKATPGIQGYGGMSQETMNAIRDNNALEEDVERVQGMVGDLNNTFTNLFYNVGNGWKGMIDSMMNSFRMLVAQIASKAVIFGILSVLSGGTGSIGRLAGGLLGGKSFKSFMGFAGGTNFAPGGMSLVGERGPELVNLPRGSKVIPNNKLGGSGEMLVTKIRGSELDIILKRHYKTLAATT